MGVTAKNRSGEIAMVNSRNNLTQVSKQLFLNDEEIKVKAKIKRKYPSKISLLLLIFLTLSIYNFGISQLSNSASNFVNTAMEKLLY